MTARERGGGDIGKEREEGRGGMERAGEKGEEADPNDRRRKEGQPEVVRVFGVVFEPEEGVDGRVGAVV
jgi:hypothetical protein